MKSRGPRRVPRIADGNWGQVRIRGHALMHGSPASAAKSYLTPFPYASRARPRSGPGVRCRCRRSLTGSRPSPGRRGGGLGPFAGTTVREGVRIGAAPQESPRRRELGSGSNSRTRAHAWVACVSREIVPDPISLCVEGQAPIRTRGSLLAPEVADWAPVPASAHRAWRHQSVPNRHPSKKFLG